MLDAMSKILVFTMEEKEILGLVVKQKVQGANNNETNKVEPRKAGFTDSLFSYLMGNEDEEDETVD